MTAPSLASRRMLAIVNALVVAFVVFWNYWVAVRGFAGRTVGGMSDVYDTLFTPASYAFSIWGLIFLGLVVHAAYQLWLVFGRQRPPDGATAGGTEILLQHRATLFERLGPWLILTNVANALWTVLWLSEQTAASAATLTAMVVFLFIAMHRLDMEMWDAPLEVIALVWWPIVIYAGWVTVAVLANVSALLAKHGWVPGDSEPWAIAMILVATIVSIGLVIRRNMREHALVVIWALAAIAARRWGEVHSVQVAATCAAGLLALVTSAHAFKNRHSLPFLRRRGPRGHDPGWEP